MTRWVFVSVLTIGFAVAAAVGPVQSQPAEKKQADPPPPAAPADEGIAPADQWPLFRGSLRMTGVSGSQLPPTPVQLWFVELKEPIETTAALYSNVAYVPTMDGTCVALSLDDGKELWRFVNPDKDSVKCSPCVDSASVFYGDDKGTFRALDRKTGEELWKFAADGEILSCPTLIDGKVIFGSYDERLYCLDARSGKLVWKLQTQGPVHCSPSLVDGNQVVVAGCDGFLRLVKVADGKETKSLEIGGNIASTPAVEGKFLFLGTMSNQVIGVDWEKMERVWTFESPKRRFPFYSSPAISQGMVIIGGRDKLVRALEASSGREKWVKPTEGRVDSSPVVVGKYVFFGSNDGNLHSADVKSGEVRWDFSTGSSIVGSPSVAGGKMVVGTQDGTVYCFGARK